MVKLTGMIQLGVNIDHIATIRQARRTYEPDPAWAAVQAQLGGADQITVHLREDRRHVQDDDLNRVCEISHVPLNLEMAATPEMLKIALQVKPRMCTLVPEGRMEVTTEGGLDVVGQAKRLKQMVAKLRDAGLRVSAFIDAQEDQVQASARVGFQICEIHTGPYSARFLETGGALDHPSLARELAQVAAMGRLIQQAGMQFNAGHSLNYVNVMPIAGLAGVRELHIGHAIVSRAVFTGLTAAVAEMKRLMMQAAGDSR